MTDAELKELVAKAHARYEAMTTEQQREMWTAQRRSWVKGNLMLDNPEMTEAEADMHIQALAVSHQNQSAMRSEAEPVQTPSKGQETPQ